MAVDASLMARIPVEQPATPKIARPALPNPAPVRRIVRSAAKLIWHWIVVALSGEGTEGIDESQFPSGFTAPYARGSRMVRNLWHIPF